jgi:uncharacterized membrane protein YdjX (TVP38/TMEM64 family)
VLFYGVLAAFLVSRSYDWRRRAACVGGAVAAVVLVAFSRMYLGAHYLSDVLAAICSSTVWLALCLAGGHALVRRRLKLHTVAVALMVVLLIAAGTFMPHEWWTRFEELVEHMNPLAGLAVFAAAYAAALLLLLPAWVFPVAAGAIFGLAWGIAAALLGVGASALLGLVLARYVAPARLQRAARKRDTFKAIDQAVAKEPWKFVALLRLAPAIPCGLKSYFLGLTRVEPGTYLAASMAGMAPDVLVKVYVGATGRGALAGGGPLHWVMLGAGVAALFALWFVVGRRLRARLKL